MYIKEIKILNFRNFKEASVPFHEGVNVIIGHIPILQFNTCKLRSFLKLALL